MVNKEITPSDSKYVPLTQDRFCCVPTCIQMIMLRHNIPLIPTELLGYHLGLIVPEKVAPLFWNARTGKEPLAGYGTQISKAEFNPNNVFPKLNIPLKMDDRWLIDKFSSLADFEKYLCDVAEKDKDVVLLFDWGTLNDSELESGHLCVLDKVYPESKKIRLIDPEYNTPKWKVFTMEKLYKAMLKHGAKKGAGFIEFECTKK